MNYAWNFMYHVIEFYFRSLISFHSQLDSSTPSDGERCSHYIYYHQDITQYYGLEIIKNHLKFVIKHLTRNLDFNRLKSRKEFY